MTRYLDYLRAKTRDTTSAGIAPGAIERFAMFPHQRDLAAWALRRGRAAIFAATGLGKTRIQLAWAQRVAEESGDVLILAPLAVADQTVTEGASTIVRSNRTFDESPQKPSSGCVRERAFAPGINKVV